MQKRQIILAPPLSKATIKVDLRTLGIEPRLYDWKSHSLPLTYVRWWLPGVEPGTIKRHATQDMTNSYSAVKLQPLYGVGTLIIL